MSVTNGNGKQLLPREELLLDSVREVIDARLSSVVPKGTVMPHLHADVDMTPIAKMIGDYLVTLTQAVVDAGKQSADAMASVSLSMDAPVVNVPAAVVNIPAPQVTVNVDMKDVAAALVQLAEAVAQNGQVLGRIEKSLAEKSPRAFRIEPTADGGRRIVAERK